MKKIYFLLLVAFMTMTTSAQIVIDVNDYFTAKTENPIIKTADGEITIITEKGLSNNAPIFNLGYQGAENDVRIYAGGGLSISAATKTITKVEFSMSIQGLKRWASVDVNTGEVDYRVDDAITAWTGSSNSISLIVGSSVDYGTESSKAGQFCFTHITIYFADDSQEGDNDGEDEGNEEAPSAVDNIRNSGTFGKAYNIFGAEIGDDYQGMIIKDGKKTLQLR